MECNLIDMKERKVLQERDISGSMLDLESCEYMGSTGDAVLDDQLLKLANEIADPEKACLLAEMMVTAVRTSKGTVSRANFKMMNRTLKEMRYANEIFHPYKDRPTRRQ